MPNEFLSMWDADGGQAARCYAQKPYGHYKEEVYPLFGEILDAMGDGIRVLDIGAGPGHCAVEFYKRRPRSTVRFALMDVGRAMLDIATKRLADMGVTTAECFQRSFNVPGWDEGLGRLDAVISNNALFHVKPGLLAGFYRTVYGLLLDDGLLLSQQAFAHEHGDFADALEGFPGVLSPRRSMTEQEARRWEQLKAKAAELNAAAERKRTEEAARRRAEGREVTEDAGAYANLCLPASAHVARMRDAGFRAGCIWRKMESAVLVGIKGSPFPGKAGP